MKYIRTKNEIFELMFPNEEQQMSFDHKTIEPAYYTTKNDWVAKKDVIKEADTIEELCDEFVYRKEGRRNEVYTNLSDKEDDLTYMGEGWEIIGAIWTDKGLIYVAKMNGKGTLELL